MKKSKIIFPHPILLIEGSIFFIILLALTTYTWYVTLFRFSEGGIPATILAIAFSACLVWFHVIFGHHIFSRLLITDKYIIYYGLFLPTVKLAFEDIKYIEIRTFNRGNVMYNKNSPNVDSYKFILLSSSVLPQKRIDKIRSSRKQALIKFAVSYKLCRALAEHIEQPSPINYQLLLYKRAKK